MGTKGIKAASTSIYYNFPSWLIEPLEIKDYIVLDNIASVQEIDAFIMSIFVYNSIPIHETAELSFDTLLDEMQDNGIVLGGGLLFYDESSKILPSCCSGLEDWKDMVEECLALHSPWLGHDPNPGIQYTKDTAKVWSDDPAFNKKGDVYSITYDLEEFKAELLSIENDIEEFITNPFLNRVKELCESTHIEIVHAIASWLSISIN